MYVSASVESEDEVVSDDQPLVEGETNEDRQLRHELNQSRTLRRARIHAPNLNRDFEEEGVFKSPAANIMSAVHLLDGLEANPSIEQAKIRLEATTIRVDRFDGGRSASKGGGSSSHRRGPCLGRQSSHYSSSNERPRSNNRPFEQPCEQPREQPHVQPRVQLRVQPV